MSGSIRVLHVDDDPDFAALAGTFLEREDDRIEVETATGASEAVDMLAADRYDCIVSDYDMPGRNGLEFLRSVRERDADLPFILFTGKGSEEIASEAISAGVTDYLQKGGGTDQYAILANRVTNAVEATAARRRSDRRKRELERYRAAVETAGDAIYALDSDGYIRMVNRALVEFSGHSRETLIGTPASEFLSEETAERTNALLQELREEGGDARKSFTIERETADGTRRVYENKISLLTDDDRIVGSVGIIREVTDRVAEKRELERQKRRLEAIVNNLPIVVFAFDEDGGFTLSQGRALSSLGFEPREVVGESVFDAFAEYPRILDNCRRALDGESVTTIQDYEGRSFKTWYEPMPDAEGRVDRVVGVSIDITDQTRQKRQLERQNDLFAKAQDIARVGAWEYDTGGDLWWSDEVKRIHGVPSEYRPSLEGAIDFYHPDDRSIIREAFESAVTDGESYDVEVRLVDVDDELRWVRTRGEPQYEDGDLVRIRGTIQDVTERKRRQDALEALHAVARSIQTERTVEAVCERTIAAATDIFDFDLCTVVIREDDWLVPYATSEDAPPDGSRRMRIDQGLAGKTYQTGTSVKVDEITPDDETDPASDIYRSGISVPIGDHGVFQAVRTDVGGFTDADVERAELLVAHTVAAIERIDRERELQRQNERLEEFASVVSHDLRNPVTVAMGNLELARAECDSGHLDAVAESLDRVETIIETMLTLARQGKTVDALETVDLVDLVGAAWEHVATENASLVLETDSHVRADRSRTQQLLENLVRNAIDHGGEDVRLTVGDLDDGTGFYVADDGPGVPEDVRERVFESGYSTTDDGTGFGLSIVEAIAEAHGWTVSVTESEGGGARFEISGVDVVG